MASIVIRWAAASDADVNTDYKVYSDYAQSGTFALVVTQNSTLNAGKYPPVTSTLAGSTSATETTIVLASGTDFNTSDYVSVDGEIIKLGTKSTATFSGSTRGVGSSVAIAHNTGATVTVLHETYTYTLPPLLSRTTRYVTRIHVSRIQPNITGSIESSPVEIISVSPPEPTTSNLITVWGIIEDIQGNPRANIDLELELQATYEWGQDTGETVRREVETTKTDSDGFFYFFVRKPSLRQHTSGTKLTVDANSTYETVWTLTLTDAMTTINYLECGTVS